MEQLDTLKNLVNKVAFALFSVIGGLILLGVYAITKKIPVLFLIIFVTYIVGLYIILLSKASNKTKYLIKTIPLATLLISITSLILLGFIKFLIHNNFIIQLQLVNSVVQPQLIIIIGLILVIITLWMSILAIIKIIKTLSIKHHLHKKKLRFYTQKNDWEIDLTNNTLVIAENKVFACKNEEEVETALDYINKPQLQRFFSKSIDGTYYLQTDNLIKELATKGCKIIEDHFATIVKN